MQLVILAGGKGTRLYPLTKDIPKVMISLNKKPALEYTINWANKYGIRDIIICVGYLHNKIEEYFGNGSKFGVNIIYSIEKKPLGTGGPLSLIKNLIKEENFFLINGDVICNIDQNKALEFHKKNNSVITIVAQRSTHPEESDLIEADNTGRILNISLKPHKEKLNTNISNAGFYVVSKKILDFIPEEEISFEREIVIKALKNNLKVFAYLTDEYLEDIGNLDRIQRIDKEIKENQGELPKYLSDL